MLYQNSCPDGLVHLADGSLHHTTVVNWLLAMGPVWVQQRWLPWGFTEACYNGSLV